MSQGIAGYDLQNKDFYKRNTLNINGDKECLGRSTKTMEQPSRIYATFKLFAYF